MEKISKLFCDNFLVKFLQKFIKPKKEADDVPLVAIVPDSHIQPTPAIHVEDVEPIIQSESEDTSRPLTPVIYDIQPTPTEEEVVEKDVEQDVEKDVEQDVEQEHIEEQENSVKELILEIPQQESPVSSLCDQQIHTPSSNEDIDKYLDV